MDWKNKSKRAFISHKRDHREFMGHLSSALNDWRVHGFVAHDAIPGGRKWRKEILDALRTCDFAIAYVTPDWNEGAWTNQEVGIALALGKPIVSVMAGMEPVAFLNVDQGVPHAEDQKAPALAQAVMAALMNTDPKVGSEVMVNALVGASSFDMARDAAKAIPQVQYATAEMLAELEQAVQSNSQITNLTPNRMWYVEQAVDHIKALVAESAAQPETRPTGVERQTLVDLTGTLRRLIRDGEAAADKSAQEAFSAQWLAGGDPESPMDVWRKDVRHALEGCQYAPIWTGDHLPPEFNDGFGQDSAEAWAKDWFAGRLAELEKIVGFLDGDLA